MKNDVEEIIKMLAFTKTEKHLFNPYNQVDTKCDLNTAPGLRQNNLRMYLDAYNDIKVEEMWITEFIDPMTTKLSGIPLIAPAHLSQVQNILHLPGMLEIPIKNSLIEPNSKLDAVWSKIEKYGKKPLVWSIIPFYLNKNYLLNLKASFYESELLKYKEILHRIIDIYQPTTIYALSEQTRSHLALLEIDAQYPLKSRILNKKESI